LASRTLHLLLRCHRIKSVISGKLSGYGAERLS
jgi:hypothetical protein